MIRRVLAVLGALAGGALLAVGLLHTPLGRSWLARLGGCPVRNSDSAAVQRNAQLAVAADRGDTLATTRPALGFALERTRRADLENWARAHGLSCEATHNGSLFQCKRVPALALPQPGGMVGTIDDLTFAFRDDGTLWTVSAWSFGLSGVAAAERARAVLTTMPDAPSNSYGRLDDLGRERPGLGFGAKYGCQNYVINLVATNTKRGVMLQQQYSSIAAAGSRQL